MSQPIPRVREWPAPDLDASTALIAFLDFLHVTALNKVAGLTQGQACATPLPDSPVSPLGLLKHLTAVQRQHLQIHLGGLDLELLWNADDSDEEFRLTPEDTIDSVVEAFDNECRLSRETLASLDWSGSSPVYDEEVGNARMVVDVLQETARHVGHLDIVRELIDGSTGE